MADHLENKVRFYELDIIRFLAALAVLFYHYTFGATRLYGAPEFSIDKILRYGYLGVDAFFMISGYVVLMSSMEKTPKYFFISRITRLYPAYWVSCVLTFLILYFGKFTSPGAPPATFKLLAYNLTMLQAFFGKLDLNGVFWTLAYEITFYFIILMISALKLWKNLLLIILLWLIYTGMANPNVSNNAFAFLLMPKFSCCFIAGMLFYLLRINYAANWKIALLLIVCFLLNIRNDIAFLKNMNAYYHDGSAYKTYIMVIIVTLFYAIFLLSAWGKLTNDRLKPFAHLGNLTYPFYLTHAFGIGAFMVFGGQVNKYLLLAATTFAAVLLAAAIHEFVEKGTRRKFKHAITYLLDSLRLL